MAGVAVLRPVQAVTAGVKEVNGFEEKGVVGADLNTGSLSSLWL
jgi:hypothetical protein